jgi:hypothetical protein
MNLVKLFAWSPVDLNWPDEYTGEMDFSKAKEIAKYYRCVSIALLTPITYKQITDALNRDIHALVD